MKFLVPIDGSQVSHHTMEVAKDMGEKFNADLILFTVIPEMNIFEEYPVNFPSELDIEKVNIKRAKNILDKAKLLFKDYPYEITYVYKIGNPYQEIIKYADKEKVDLIIIGNRGLGAFSRTLLGSVSNKVLNKSNISVLVVKSNKEEH